MSNLDHNFMPGDEMRSPRQRRLIRAQLTDAHGVNFDIVIRNVSERGVGASTQGRPPLRGGEVAITIPKGMTMKGMVRWVEGSAFGIELEDSIQIETLTELIQRKHESAGQEGQWEVRRIHQVDTGHPDPNRLRKI